MVIGKLPDRHVSPYEGKDCDFCRAGDHGACWRAVCHCKHHGWTRDPNAQGPFGVKSDNPGDETWERASKKAKKRKAGKKKNPVPTYNIVKYMD